MHNYMIESNLTKYPKVMSAMQLESMWESI